MCKNLFIKSVLIFFLFFGAFFVFKNPALADNSSIYLDSTGYSYRQNPDDGVGNFTFSNTIASSCVNSFLIATVATYGDDNGWDSVSYGGAVMSDSGIGQQTYVGQVRQMRWQTFVLASPHAGTNTFHIHNTRGQYSDPATIVLQTFCNVDQSNPLDFVRGGVSNYGGNGINSGYFNITNDNSLVLFDYILATGGTVSGTSGYASSSLNAYNWSGQQIFNFFSSTMDHKTAGDYYSVGGTDTDWARSIDVFVLNYSNATPNLFCGDGFCNNNETCSSCSNDCGRCSYNSTVYLDSTGYSYLQSPADDYGHFSFSNTIASSCINSFLVASVATYNDGNNWDDVYYDGVAMSDSGIGQQTYVGQVRQMRWQTFVLTNPHSGTHNFVFHNTRGQYSDPATIVLQTFCNVDQNNPLDFVRGGMSNYGGNGISSGYFNITNDNSLVLFDYILATGGTVSGTPGYASSTLNAYNAGNNQQIHNFFSDTIDHKNTGDYYSVGGTDTDWARSIDVFVLNYSG